MPKSQPSQHVPRNSSAVVLAGDAVVAALLLFLLELEGFSLRYPRRNEKPAAAIERLKPHVAIVDCDHVAAADDAFYAAAADAGTGIVIFSALPGQEEVARAAARRGVRWFTVPLDRARLRRVLRDVRQDAAGNPG